MSKKERVCAWRGGPQGSCRTPLCVLVSLHSGLRGGSDFTLCDLGHFALPPFSADGPQQQLPFLLPGERRGWVRAYSAQLPHWHPPTVTFFFHESEDSAAFWDSWVRGPSGFE